MAVKLKLDFFHIINHNDKLNKSLLLAHFISLVLRLPSPSPTLPLYFSSISPQLKDGDLHAITYQDLENDLFFRLNSHVFL